jgi:hypothetical protein
VVLLLAAAIIVAGVIAVAMGRGGELAPAPADFAPLDLAEVTSTDVALLRPPSALWGYHREATDEALSQIARTISDQEVQIATLQRQLAELLPTRNPRRNVPGDGMVEPRTGPVGMGPALTGPVGTRPGGPPFPDLDPPPGMEPPPWVGHLSWTESPPPVDAPAAADPPPGAEPPVPSRPSVLHRELADQASAPDPAPAADPWSAWQRRSADETTSRTSADAASGPGPAPGPGPGPAPGPGPGPGPDPRAARREPAADPGEGN